MPAVDTGGAKGKRGKRLKKTAKPKPPTVPDAKDPTRSKRKSTAPPKTPDAIDRERQPRTPPPPVKVRAYAHPQRPEPTKVITRIVRQETEAKAKRVELKQTAGRIHVTPVPSPDARDSTRTPAQLKHDAKVVAKTVKASRVKALRKGHKGVGVRQIKAELEGRGELAKGLGKLADKGAKNAGGGQPILGRTPKYASVINENLGSRAVKDVINLPAQTIPSLYIPAAGLVEKAQGRPERLRKFGEHLKQNDPVYNTVAAGVAKAKGDDKAAASHLRKAKKAASEHPGFTAAEVYGIRGAVGRTAGAGVRGAAKITGSRTLDKIGTTKRAPRVLPGTNLVEPRRYSKDLITKAEQVVRERNQRKVSAEARHKAQRATDPDRRVELEREARSKDPDVMRDRHIARRVDEHVDAAEQVRRQHRTETTAKTHKLTKKVAKKAGPVLSLVAQRIAHADVPDLKAYVRELELEHPKLGPAAKRANEQLRHKLTKAITQAEAGKLDLSKVKDVADAYARESQASQAALVKRGMLDKDQAETAALMPYAVRRMGAKHDGDKLVGPTGAALPSAAIKAHMAAHNVEPPAFLSQAANARGAKNFYVNSAKPPKATGARRTGEATRKGTFDAHPDTLIEQAARGQGLVDAFDHFQQFLDEFAYRDPRGRGGVRTKRSKKDADTLAANLSAKGDSVEWQAVRVNPFGATKEQLQQMLDGTAPGTPVHTALTQALAGEGEGPWAIVPKAAADRLGEHTRMLNPGNSGRVARKVSSSFRQTVLATSLKWGLNNALEAGFRSAIARAGPRSYVTGRGVLKAADRTNPAKAEFLRARTVGGGHYSMAQRADIHFDVERLTDSTIRDISRPLTAFWKAPGPKHVAGAWHAYTHFVFNVVNKYVEQQFQTAMLGKATRDLLLDDRLRKLSKDAIDQAAKGAVDRNTAAQLGRAIDRMYGRYGKMRPDERKAIALYTPFIMWAQNAAYFVTRTLPQDHPVTLAVIAATVNAEQEWLQDHGLDQFITDRVPGFLQGSVPGKDGVKYRAPTNSLPFGFFTDPTGALGGLFLPQLASAIDAFEGRDWKGKPLRNEDGSEYNVAQKSLAAGAAFLNGTIPVLAVKRQVEKGPKGQLDSITGKVTPKEDTPTLKPPRIKKESVTGYGKGAYGSGAYGGGSPFK